MVLRSFIWAFAAAALALEGVKGCTVTLERQLSSTPCNGTSTFGCFAGNHSMWAGNGCRGRFECDGVSGVSCGAGFDKQAVCPCVPPPPSTKLAFAHVYTSSMVLQRAPHSASVWGWAGAGVTVTVTAEVEGVVVAAANATASASGQWRVSLPPQPASSATASATLTARSSTQAVTLVDVLFGDVFVCSGQSNMAFSLSVPTNDEAAEAKISAAYASDPGASPHGKYISTDHAINLSASYSDLRFLVVGNKLNCPDPIADWYPSPATEDPELALAHPWQKSSPASVGGAKDVMGGENPPAPGAMSAVCWYYGMELRDTQKTPIGLIHSSYGGSALESWVSNGTLGDDGTGACTGPITGGAGLPSQQWNGMIVPLLNTTIKGALWYQGETNAGQDGLYACRFSQLMEEWRSQWHIGTGGATDPEFPFGFVQLGCLGCAPLNESADPFPTFKIRMGQTADFGYAPNARWPNTFMAAALDLANPPGTNCFLGCVHIFNKQAVAHRLALAARSAIYNESVVFTGPRVERVTQLNSSSLAVKYSRVGTDGQGIKLRSSYGFEVCTVVDTKRANHTCIPPPPPPPRPPPPPLPPGYKVACTGGRCVPAKGGFFPSLHQCSKHCHTKHPPPPPYNPAITGMRTIFCSVIDPKTSMSRTTALQGGSVPPK